MKEFKYLGSLVGAHGRMTGEVNRRIVQALKILVSFAILAHDLSIETKRLSVVLGILLTVQRPGLPLGYL